MRAAALLVVLAAGAARAEPLSLWDDVAHPNRLRCDKLTDEARRLAGWSRNREAHRRALPVAEEAAKLCPGRADALALLGEELLELGEVGRARQVLERARALAPGDRDARLAFSLGTVRAREGEYEAALVELRRAEALGGVPDAALASQLGECLMAAGRLDEATVALERAVARAPALAVPRLLLALALDRAYRPGRARVEIEAALARDRALNALNGVDAYRHPFIEAADAHWLRALVYLLHGRNTEAAQSFRRFLEAFPQSPYAERAREHLAALEP